MCNLCTDSPIGVHQKVINILKSRLAEAGYTAGLEGNARDQQTAVLLLGRGSSDGDANSDFYKMARMFWEQVPVKWAESSFIGVTEPSFEDGLERACSWERRNLCAPLFLVYRRADQANRADGCRICFAACGS